MLPVEEKSPSVTAASAAAAAARNLSLNLNNPANPGSGTGGPSSKQPQFKDVLNGGSSVASNGARSSVTTSASGKVIKSAIKTNHRYQLVSSSSSSVEENGGSGGSAVTNGKKKFSKRNGAEEPVRNGGNGSAAEDLSDEHTSLLGSGSGSKSVKSDKNFNLIVVNGNANGAKLASVLKKNGSATGSGSVVTGANGDGAPLKATTTNGYSAVRTGEHDEDDADEPEEEDYPEEDEEYDLVAANNRKNTTAGIITAKMSTSASVTRSLNGINGNSGAGAAPQQQSSVETPSSGIIVDTSDADSEQTAVSGVSGSGGGGGGGGKKVKMNKLGGSKNVTLKRVSFGSSKGSMVETLVFETPTPLPEHAEREFFHSPAVLAGAGTTVNSVHHHYQHHHHLPHYHHPLQQQQQGQSQQSDGSLAGLDDSGIELQEEVERSKVRVSFFQSSKPQSISPPESLLFGGGQNLIHFGPGSGGGGGGGGYDNNNTLLDSSYITSAALNQQYDSLLAGHHHTNSTFQYNPDDPASMAAVMAYDRQMSTESGWDNPFRPGGDLSREADEIVNLIKGGKPITPTGDQSLLNGSAPKDSSHDGPTENGGSTVVDGVATKLESTQLQSQQPNGTKSPQKGTGPDAAAPTTAASPQKNGSAPAGGATATSQSPANQTQVSNQVIPGPQSASHVVIDEKKKKKCACCVIQ
uniref:Putative agap000086-pd-like protein n=1 Tax=Culex tarsalis TaxID=7177 RepID=A0A1Q3FUA6_CULTA